jgi:hypothetical protein
MPLPVRKENNAQVQFGPLDEITTLREENERLRKSLSYAREEVNDKTREANRFFVLFLFFMLLAISKSPERKSR